MRLLRVHIIRADTCGGLLDGLDVHLRPKSGGLASFDPLCLIGPNGAGKSQFLQVVAEMFQSAFHVVLPHQERLEGNPSLEFEVEYAIESSPGERPDHVRISRRQEGKKLGPVRFAKLVDGKWNDCPLDAPSTLSLLPKMVIGYTSGDNETLSLPFLLSRSGYADEVGKQALHDPENKRLVPETKLIVLDYGTNLEVLISNLLMGTEEEKDGVLSHARLDKLHSFRCIVQLAHSAVPKLPSRKKAKPIRKGVQLTAELEEAIDRLKRCSTCYDYDEDDERYTFDYFADEALPVAFKTFWDSSFALYSALHKLGMLNDLAIPRKTRRRFVEQTKERRFATRLPEPQDEEKVFRFDRVRFHALQSEKTVDYVSLSDGEHQFAQLLGTFCMISMPGVLFLLDEPESHFNPRWRVEFISKLLNQPTPNGIRREESAAAKQDALMTTHAPFVPSDMPRDRVLIFGKDPETSKLGVRLPEIETFGTTFDSILEECFGVRPPISQESRDEIETAMQSNDPKTIRAIMAKLGYSVEKAFLADRLRQLEAK